MTINNVEVPPNMYGRAFPFKDNLNQFEGICVINNIQYRMVHWINKTKEGRSYIRTVFEPIDAEQGNPPCSNTK